MSKLAFCLLVATLLASVAHAVPTNTCTSTSTDCAIATPYCKPGVYSCVAAADCGGISGASKYADPFSKRCLSTGCNNGYYYVATGNAYNFECTACDCSAQVGSTYLQDGVCQGGVNTPTAFDPTAIGNCVAATSCLNNMYGSDPYNVNQCVAKCLDETYANPTTKVCGTIPNCPVAQPYGDGVNNLCVDACPTLANGDDYYVDTTNDKCVRPLACPLVSFTKTWGNPDTGICVVATNCPADTYGNPDSGKCVTAPNCSTDLYGDPTSRICQAPVSCSVSTPFANRTTKMCVVADDCDGSVTYWSYGDPLSDMCEPQGCPMGYYADSTTSPYNYICTKCDCSAQSSTTYLQNGVCPGLYGTIFSFSPTTTGNCVAVTDCASETYGDKINEVDQCVIPVNCSTTKYANTSTDLCVIPTNCPTGEYGNPTTKYCVEPEDCPSDKPFANGTTRLCGAATECPTSTFANPTTQICGVEGDCPIDKPFGDKNCPKDAYKNKKTSTCTGCTTSCPKGSYLKGTPCNGKGTKSPTCVKCTPQSTCVKNTGKCSKDPDYSGKLKCSQCDKGYTLQSKGVCKKEVAPKRRMLAESSPAENRTSETLPPVVAEPFLQKTS